MNSKNVHGFVFKSLDMEAQKYLIFFIKFKKIQQAQNINKRAVGQVQ